jgi:hypothetical protein
MTPDDFPQFARHTVVNAVTGCWEWQGQKHGYAETRLSDRTKIRVTRYVFELVHGYLPEVVMHTCDNPTCWRPDHLRAGTHVENRADCVAKGRHARGERNARAKLTAAQAAEIRRMVGASPHLVAEAFGVSDRAVTQIWNGETWKEAQANGF